MIVVLTPDVKEARGLLGAFSRSGFVAQDATLGVLPCFVLPDLDMLVAVGGNGKAQFAAQTQYVLDRCPETNTAHAAFQANVGSVMSNVAQLLAAWRCAGQAPASIT